MRDIRILFFGDSFVTGFGDPTGLGWVGRVVAASAEAGLPITAYNLGVRGQTSEEVAARWLLEAEPRIDESVDCRVVFSFGANDVGRLAPERSLAVLEGVLAAARERGLRVFVVGPSPLGDERDSRIAELSDAFIGACQAQGAPFIAAVPALSGHPAWSAEAASNDSVHPGSQGYAELARLVLAGGWLDWLRADYG